jgi:hypothetical protein
VFASVLGGYSNDVSGAGSTVINGEDNDIAGDFALIGGGVNNYIDVNGDYGVILGGINNILNHKESFIIGSNITSHLSGFTYVNNLSATEKFYGDGSELTGIVSGDTEATTLVRSNSAEWGVAYNIATTYQTASSTFLTSETDSQTLYFNETSKNLSISNGNTVSLSALIDISTDTEVRALTSNWENTFTTVQANSSNWGTAYSSTTALNLSSGLWNSTYTLVQSESANWGTGGVAQNLTFNEIANELSLSLGNTVSLSSLAGAGGDPEATTLVRSNSANWDSSYTIVQSNSANWQTTFQSSSAYVISNPTGISGASALTKLLQITQAGYNAITPASDTLYIIVG